MPSNSYYLREAYLQRVKQPIVKVYITQYWADQKPSVEERWNDLDPHIPPVINCDIGFGFDQGSATCSLVVTTPWRWGYPVRFKPMDRVKVVQGYDNADTFHVTFYGFIDSVDMSDFPRLQRIECRDILKLTQNNYYLEDNSKIYGVSHQSEENRYAEKVIEDFLVDSGIPLANQSLNYAYLTVSGEVPPTGQIRIVVGENQDVEFINESAWDAISRICEHIGYRCWADRTGIVRLDFVRPYASGDVFHVFTKADETIIPSGQGWDVNTVGNLLSIDVISDDEDLRNYIIVSGYVGIRAVVYGESMYVTDPPQYRRMEKRTDLVDTQAMADSIAERVYLDLNRLRWTGRARIEGFPLLEIGQTLGFTDDWVTNTGEYWETDEMSAKFFLYDFSSRHDQSGYTMDLMLVGGVGTGALEIENRSPTAAFEYTVEQEAVAGSTNRFVFVDASTSSDPDDDFDDLTFLWVCSGYSNSTNVTNSYTVTDAGVANLSVTLTVTDDGTPALSNSITRTVVLGSSARAKILHIASGTKVYTSFDGGETWSSADLY